MRKEFAVSSVISEMLIIVLVIILIPVVTINLMYQLPETRVPTVTIMMTPLNDGKFQLYHKGGDTINGRDIKIIVGETEISLEEIEKIPYDLGDKIPNKDIPGKSGDRVSLIIKNSVVFSGTV